MNVITLMDSKQEAYTKTERRIYEGIKKFPTEFANESITTISESNGVNKPALTRFAQKLGFSGFLEFQYQLSQDLKKQTANLNSFSNAEAYANLLKMVEEQMNLELLENLAKQIKSARAVYIIGANLSRLPAEELNIALNFNPAILSLQPNLDALPADYDPNDLLIIYSATTGSSHQSLMKQLRRESITKPFMILITTNSKHPLRHNFDTVVTLPSIPLSQASEAILSDTFSFLMFNEMLTNAVNKKDKSTNEVE